MSPCKQSTAISRCKRNRTEGDLAKFDPALPIFDWSNQPHAVTCLVGDLHFIQLFTHSLGHKHAFVHLVIVDHVGDDVVGKAQFVIDISEDLQTD